MGATGCQSEEQGCFLEFACGAHGALGLAHVSSTGWQRIYEIISSCTIGQQGYKLVGTIQFGKDQGSQVTEHGSL